MKLKNIDITPYLSKKGELDFLNWAVAWELASQECPGATWEPQTWEGKPFCQVGENGILVGTKVTIAGYTQSAILYCMTENNEAAKKTSDCTAKDVGDTIMRCLVKNLAMFGLGLDLWKKGHVAPPPQDLTPIKERLSTISTIDELNLYYKDLEAPSEEVVALFKKKKVEITA